MHPSRERDSMLSERNGTKKIQYSSSSLNERAVIIREQDSPSFVDTRLNCLKKGFAQVFLPEGYPQSVSSDYIDYQLWDTVQAFCSTISGTLTTHAIFQSVGVGDTNATALSATITWIMKDGTGMIGRIAFAWWRGCSLDADCKKWRLIADVINDVAMFVELLLGNVYLKTYSSILLCCSTGMKSIVGVAGGATRAAITQHQAIRNNMADVSAKDGSQETCVNLISSFVAVFILTRIEESSTWTWTVFIFVTIFHIFANYKAVKSLKIKTLNESRLLLLIQYYLRYGQVFGIDKINLEESVFPGFGLTDYVLCKRRIHLGNSLKKTIPKFDADYLNKLRMIYEAFPYCIAYDDESICVMLRENITDRDVIMSYFHALILGVCFHRSSSMNSESSDPIFDDLSQLLNNRQGFGSIETLVNAYVMEKWTFFIENLNSKGKHKARVTSTIRLSMRLECQSASAVNWGMENEMGFMIPVMIVINIFLDR